MVSISTRLYNTVQFWKHALLAYWKYAAVISAAVAATKYLF